MNDTSRWYKQGEALLKEIGSAECGQETALIWFMGQHGFVIKLNGKIIYIDVLLNALYTKQGKEHRCYPSPFLPEQVTAIDYFFCTHGHRDHLNMETLLPIARTNPQARFIVPRPLVPVLTEGGISPDRINAAAEGERLELPGQITVDSLAAAHPDYTPDSRGDYPCLGYVIRGSGISIYHAGDTYASPRLADTLKSLSPIDAAMLPINGGDWERTARGIIGNMSPLDAVKLTMAVSVDLVIPTHYDMIEGNTDNPAAFAAYMYELCPAKKYHIFAPGECFRYARGGQGA